MNTINKVYPEGMLGSLYSVCIAFFVVYFFRKRGDKVKSLYTVYNQRLAGYLMLNGFPLIEISKNRRTNKNDFIFANTQSLHEKITEYQNYRTNRITEDN